MTQNTPTILTSGSELDKAPELPLNADQEAAAKGFFDFLFTNEKEMKIIGPGGTGKTHLMSHLIDVIMPRYFEMCKLMGIKAEYDSVHMTALTNKAAEVLSAGTKRHVSTIHSFMNLKVMNDHYTGKSSVMQTRAWKVHERIILFIDEAFMTDTPLLNYIREGTQDCKIIFVGDNCQMGPIMEAQSPIDALNVRTYELTIPMRTSDPNLLALNNQLRNTVKSGVFHPIVIVPGVIDLLDDTQMERSVMQTFYHQTLETRILAYTNARVQLYNDFIRQVRQLPPMFTVGEQLINNSAIRLSGDMLSVEEEVTITALGPIQKHVIEASDDPDQEVALDVQLVDIATSVGNVHEGVPIPLDKDHFAALIKYYTRIKKWNRMYYLKENFPDLRQRDAATVYKAQGSTHRSVFIDLGDISNCRNPDQAARLLYVAASRAKQRVFLYGTLAEKFGGLLV